MSDKKGGLAGVVAGDSSIATVGKKGKGLNYRGYSIDDLAEKASFEEVAYLLLFDKLPTQKELDQYTEKLIQLRTLPGMIKTLLQNIPRSSHPMDVMRTAFSFLGNIEPEKNFDQQYYIANRFLALAPSVICYWYAYHFKNLEISEYSDEKTIGGHFLALLHGYKPHELEVKLINTSLILYAEHEFNASTFAARVTAATLSDFYSCMVSAIGTLRGPLHGGANEAAMELIKQFSNPDDAEKGLKEMLKNKAKIMGFGHRVYTENDPRSDIIKLWSQRLAKEKNDLNLFDISERIEKIMWNEKKLFPNLDFYSASAYHYCGIPTFLFTPIFVMSRISGWAAHIFEQRADNHLIRPVSNYVGPESRAYLNIKDRK